MAAPKTEVDVWVTADGEVRAIGHKVEGAPAKLEVTPVEREGQSTRKVEADLDQIAAAESLRLNPDSGELESY